MRNYEEALKEYKEEIAGIADLCAEEGYPSHGSNFELMVDALRPYYPELFADQEEED